MTVGPRCTCWDYNGRVNLTRRSFGLSVIPFGFSVLPAAGPDARWALLSDTHIPTDPEEEYRGFRPYENLKKALVEVKQVRPDGVVVSGDLARLRGQASDYTNFRGLMGALGEDLPIALAMGNHDNRENFLGVLGPQPNTREVKGKHVSVVETGAVRFVILDSLFRTDEVFGYLGMAQRQWLSNFLATAKPVPTILFVHHNLDDGDSALYDSPRLFDAIRPHRHVKAIVYGHTHVYRFKEFEGIHLINIPALGYNFMDDKPIGWVEAAFSASGGSFKLHAIGGNRGEDGQITHLKWRA
jgi:3',5'-cyclic-AMP phosphodiesterase